MATETLSPIPVQRFYDNNNNPAVNAKVFTYAAGTTTKLATYTDSTGSMPNSNPIILNSRGECNLWIPPNISYKYIFAPSTDTDPPTNPFWTIDNIVNSQLITLYGGVDTGSTNVYVLIFTSNFTSYTDGIVIYWIPAHDNTGASTLNVNGLGAVAIKNQDGTALTAGEIVTNQVAIVLYKGGNFLLLSASSVFITSSFVGTLTGLTTSPTVTVNYRRSGSLVTLWLPSASNGTSNAQSFTITGIPASIRPSAEQHIATGDLVDNGVTDLSGLAIITIAGTIQFGLATVTGTKIQYLNNGFTIVGTKGIQGGWSITYSL